MHQYLFAVVLVAGFAAVSPATARDNFKTGSTAYSVGLYGSNIMWAECSITDRACDATGSRPTNGS